MDIIRNFLAVIAVAALSCTGFQASAQKDASALKLSTVVIDPGHGGNDPGASGNGLQESTLTWKIASALRERLVANGKSEVVNLQIGVHECHR